VSLNGSSRSDGAAALPDATISHTTGYRAVLNPMQVASVNSAASEAASLGMAFSPPCASLRFATGQPYTMTVARQAGKVAVLGKSPESAEGRAG
jgi:hypothetical protein